MTFSSRNAARISASSLLVLLCVSTLRAEPADRNWGEWRGPAGTGAAPAADPPTTWSETQNIRWKVKLPGSGQGSAVIWDNYVFVQTAIPTGRKPAASADVAAPAAVPTAAAPGGMRRGGGGGLSGGKPSEIYQFVLLCLDRQTGKTIWQKVCCEQVPHEGHHSSDGSFASASPITDGKRVFAFFGSRGLYCFDMEGNLKWSQNFGQMRIAMTFGEGSTPALAGDVIVVNWDHEGDSFIVALNADTGKEIWRKPRQETTSWATPLIVEFQGKRQVVTAATKKIRSYDLENGNLLWECGGMTRNVIPSPVAADGVVYCTSGFMGSAALAIKLGKTGDLTGTDAILWRYGSNTPYVPSPLLFDGKLYFFASNNAVLTSLDAKTGKVLIGAKRVNGLDGVYASPIGAAGRVYITGRNGTTVVIKNTDTLDVIATNKLDDKIDASAAVAGKDLFLRGHEYLYCIAEK